MTNTEIIATIRNEIERLIKESDFDESANLYSLLSFLSTLESEKPMQEGLEEELDRFIASGKSVTVEDCGTYKVSYHDFKKVARHFAEWQKAKDDMYIDTIYQQGIEKGKDEMREQLVSDDLEEAADEYEKKHTHQRYDGGGLTPEYDATLTEAFIAGAKWQKEQRDKELSEKIAGAYQLGLSDKEKQMMKEAVEGEYGYFSNASKTILPSGKLNIKEGDKVRVIIVNEDEK